MNLRRHWPWLFLIIPVVIGLLRLRLDVEVLNLLPQDSSVVQGLKVYQQNFSNARQLYITIDADAEFAEKAARAIAEKLRTETNLVASAVWQPPWLESPSQASELVAYLWLNQSPTIFGELTNRLQGENLTNTLHDTLDRSSTSLSPTDMAVAGYDPFGLLKLPEAASGGAATFGNGNDLFASADGRFRIVFVDAARELTTYRDCNRWLVAVKQTVQDALKTLEIPAEVKIKIGYTGRPAFVSEVSAQMEQDMTSSVGSTVVVIAILFWWAHRRFRPLLWILALLVLILVGTMGFGGLIFGTLNVVSLGFAAILLGLAVDYGLVLYQEALADPNATADHIRKTVGSSILWSAVTTSGAFAILNLSDLPGLAQLGSLVAIGVTLGAIIMLFAYLPPLLRGRQVKPAHMDKNASATSKPQRPALPWIVTAIVVLAASTVLMGKRPGFDHSPEALRPKHSPAYVAIDEMKNKLGHAQEPLWVVVPGQNEAEVARRLQSTENALRRAFSNGLISGFTLPTTLWPQPENQRANRAAVSALIAEQPRLREAALQEGFTTNALSLTESMFRTWERALAQTNVFWPTNFTSRWALDQITARKPNNFLALGLINAATNSAETKISPHQLTTTFVSQWPEELTKEGVLLSGWNVLGSSLFERVQKDLPRVMLPMLILLLGSLWLAFRRISEIILSLVTLLFAGLALYAIMGLAGWSWNLMNMMAIPLILGAGVDYSIHMQLALRRHGGNIPDVRRTVGRALWLCGGTTIAGFGSNVWANNTGMASLGAVCATGITFVMLTSIYLLPAWWRATAQK